MARGYPHTAHGKKADRPPEDVYERQKAKKRPDERFSELVDRLLDETADWREGFGTLEASAADELVTRRAFPRADGGRARRTAGTEQRHAGWQ